MKLKNTGMKLLRTFHILTASIWFGAVACIGVFAIICFFYSSQSEFLMLAPIIPRLYQCLVLPTGLLTIMQGIIYGAFTNFGFVKFKWIMIKWIAIILLVLSTGVGSIGQLYAVIDRVSMQGFKGGFADGGLIFLFIGLQILIMTIMIIISVFKPFMRFNQNLRNKQD